MAIVKYYFNSYDVGVEEWATTPEKMVDNNIANYASSALVDDIELLDGNTCAGINLGTITKVEIRSYGYGANGTVQIRLIPVFTGGDGDIHVTSNFVAPGWSNWIDITSDTNAPGTWNWTNVQNLDMDVKCNGTGNAFCSKVEIQVTYTAGGGGSASLLLCV